MSLFFSIMLYIYIYGHGFELALRKLTFCVPAPDACAGLFGVPAPAACARTVSEHLLGKIIFADCCM